MYKQHDCPSRNEYSSHRYKELLYTIGDEYLSRIYYTESSEQLSLYMAPLQDGQSADSTSDPTKNRGGGGK